MEVRTLDGAMGAVNRPETVRVCYRGIEYELDLVKCRRALVYREVEGQFGSMEALVELLDISRSTVSRFFSGRPTSLAITLRILGMLKLTFEEVARPV